MYLVHVCCTCVLYVCRTCILYVYIVYVYCICILYMYIVYVYCICILYTYIVYVYCRSNKYVVKMCREIYNHMMRHLQENGMVTMVNIINEQIHIEGECFLTSSDYKSYYSPLELILLACLWNQLLIVISSSIHNLTQLL